MTVGEFLEEITAPGAMNEEVRELIFTQKSALKAILRERGCKQLKTLEINYNLIEVSKVYIHLWCTCYIVTHLLIFHSL